MASRTAAQRRVAPFREPAIRPPPPARGGVWQPLDSSSSSAIEIRLLSSSILAEKASTYPLLEPLIGRVIDPAAIVS